MWHRSARDEVIFDTALYHAFSAPYVHSDADGRVRGPDGLLHVARNFTYYSFLSMWDTYRVWGPLMCRLQPQVRLSYASPIIASGMILDADASRAGHQRRRAALRARALVHVRSHTPRSDDAPLEHAPLRVAPPSPSPC